MAPLSNQINRVRGEGIEVGLELVLFTTQYTNSLSFSAGVLGWFAEFGLFLEISVYPCSADR